MLTYRRAEVTFNHTARAYEPIMYFNEFWNLKEHAIRVNSTLEYAAFRSVASFPLYCICVACLLQDAAAVHIVPGAGAVQVAALRVDGREPTAATRVDGNGRGRGVGHI